MFLYSNKGFSLIEVLSAFTILAIIAIPFFNFLGQNIDLLQDNRVREKKIGKIVGEIEEIKSITDSNNIPQDKNTLIKINGKEYLKKRRVNKLQDNIVVIKVEMVSPDGEGDIELAARKFLEN
ncbi:MAG: type IV pilus modification PilV family protein [Halanaerobiaceae bacterium]